MSFKTLTRWEEVIIRTKERLQEPTIWFPSPAFISIGLVMVLTGHLFPGLNPRQGNQADILTFEAPSQKEGSIWLGLYPSDGKLVLITSERKRFNFPFEMDNEKELKQLVSYLKKLVEKRAVAVGRSLETNSIKTTAVLSVDQRLNYSHIRPIISALADARISKYGFETKLLKR